MKKMISSREEKFYKGLQATYDIRKKIRRRSILFALFIFGVNIYAWFVYVSKARVRVDASVASWDINFLEKNNVISQIDLGIDIYPGMKNWEKVIDVKNNSDVKARFTMKVINATLFGEELFETNTSYSDMLNTFKGKLPFIVTLKTSKEVMDKRDTATFNTSVEWEYENNKAYFPVLKPYKYDPSIPYYVKNGNNYSEVNLDENVFNALRNNLYMNKDDADTYIGEECAKYKKATNKACLFYMVELEASQINE